MAILLVGGWLVAGWLGGRCIGDEGGAMGLAGCDGAASPASGFVQKRQNFRPSALS
jgi:hypothetical protein